MVCNILDSLLYNYIYCTNENKREMNVSNAEIVKQTAQNHTKTGVF